MTLRYMSPEHEDCAREIERLRAALTTIRDHKMTKNTAVMIATHALQDGHTVMKVSGLLGRRTTEASPKGEP